MHANGGTSDRSVRKRGDGKAEERHVVKEAADDQVREAIELLASRGCDASHLRSSE